MNDTITRRVARGAALLDERLPGWHDRIDLDRLDLADTCNCILGQEFDDNPDADPDEDGPTPYDVGVRELFATPPDGGPEEIVRAAIRHGFTTGSSGGFGGFAVLEVEWRRVILARRGGEGR